VSPISGSTTRQNLRSRASTGLPTPPEVAAFLGITPQRVRKAIAAGQLFATWFHRYSLVPNPALEASLDGTSLRAGIADRDVGPTVAPGDLGGSRDPVANFHLADALGGEDSGEAGRHDSGGAASGCTLWRRRVTRRSLKPSSASRMVGASLLMLVPWVGCWSRSYPVEGGATQLT